MRITAAVYEALKPILNEMREDIISSMKSEIANISQRVSNQTEEIDAKLSYLNESMKDNFSGVERELNGLNSTANMICDKIEEHDNEITTELIKMNETLTEQMINNSGGLKCGGTWGWRRAIYLGPCIFPPFRDQRFGNWISVSFRHFRPISETASVRISAIGAFEYYFPGHLIVLLEIKCRFPKRHHNLPFSKNPALLDVC